MYNMKVFRCLNIRSTNMGWQWIMSGKARSLSISPMSAHRLNVIYVCVLLFPLQCTRRKPIPVSRWREGGSWGCVPHPDPRPPACHWSPPSRHHFKTRHHFLPSLHTAQLLLIKKKNQKKNAQRGQTGRECVCVGQWEISSAGLRMPAYATNMRLKFPIVALTLEIITIILFALFVVYDDGKEHGHDPPANETQHEQPMDLYPSKSAWGSWLRGCSISSVWSLKV